MTSLHTFTRLHTPKAESRATCRTESLYIFTYSVYDYLTINRRRRGDYKPVFTESKLKVANCFSINFQVVTNNNQQNFIKNSFKFIE